MLWLLLALPIILTIFVFSYFLSKRVVCPKVFTYEGMIDFEEKAGRRVKDKLNNYETEDIYISSPYGYKLYGIFIPQRDSKKAVVICHGITSNIYGSLKYADIFIKLGFNVFLYDHRNHGKSGGRYTTFGYYEKYDLKACQDWVRNKVGEGCILGTMGESMGAATVLQNLSVEDDLAFCIADCPFSDLEELLSYRLKVEYHFPRIPFILIASLFSKYKTGMQFRDVSPIKDVEKSKIPILFIHGEEDRYIPLEMTKNMYQVKKGRKKLYIAKAARHAQSIIVDEEEYFNCVSDFLKHAGVL